MKSVVNDTVGGTATYTTLISSRFKDTSVPLTKILKGAGNSIETFSSTLST